MQAAACNVAAQAVVTGDLPLRLVRTEFAATERQHVGPIAGLAVVGKHMLSAGKDGRILRYEKSHRGPMRPAGPDLDAAAPCVDLQVGSTNPETTIVVAACTDCNLRLWRAPCIDFFGPNRQMCRPVAELLQGHTAGVQGLDLQGSFAVSSSDDGTARLWDLQACGEVISMGHPAGVRRTLFFPESTLLVSTCVDGATRIWDLRANPSRPSCLVQHPSTTDKLGLAVKRGGWMAHCDCQGLVEIFDIPRCGARCLSQIQIPVTSTQMQFVVQGQYLLCSCMSGDLCAVRLEDFQTQGFKLQQEPPQPVTLMRSVEGAQDCLLLFAFESHGWGFGLLQARSEEAISF